MASATETRLYCPRCETIHTIFRKTAKQKKVGHYKNFYCYKCKTTHNHIELKDSLIDKEEISKIIEQMKREGKY